MLAAAAPANLVGHRGRIPWPCFDGRPRSATALAVEDSVVYELTRAALDDTGARRPRIAIRIMANLARIMSQRMRETNEILRQLEHSRG